MKHRAPYSLRGKRWTLVSTPRATWLVIEEDDGPTRTRLHCEGNEAVYFEISNFMVFVAADRSTLFCVPDEEFDEWVAQNHPKREGAKS